MFGMVTSPQEIKLVRENENTVALAIIAPATSGEFTLVPSGQVYQIPDGPPLSQVSKHVPEPLLLRIAFCGTTGRGLRASNGCVNLYTLMHEHAK